MGVGCPTNRSHLLPWGSSSPTSSSGPFRWRRHQALGLGLRQHHLEARRGQLAVQQALSVLGEDRHISHPGLQIQADTPAEQQGIGQLFHQ